MKRFIASLLLLAYGATLVPELPTPRSETLAPKHTSAGHDACSVDAAPMSDCGCASNCGNDCECCSREPRQNPFEGRENLYAAGCGCNAHAPQALESMRHYCGEPQFLTGLPPTSDRPDFPDPTLSPLCDLEPPDPVPISLA